MVNVIKVYLQRPNSEKTEIRRLAVSSDIISRFESLCVKVIELFPLLCGKTFEISWKDSDGDLVLMSSDAELAQALANAEDGLIKIYVSLNEERDNDDADKGPVGGSVHPGIVCDECSTQIKGHRYKCLQCKDYDLCSNCNADNKHAHHDMLKLVDPVYISRKWVGDLFARRMWKSMFGRGPTCGQSFAGTPDAEEKPNCSSKPSSSDGSPTKSKWEEAFSEACKNFASAEKIFPEVVGNLLKMGGVEVKIGGGCPFGPFGGPFTHNSPSTEETSKQSKQDSNKGNDEEEKSSDNKSFTAAASEPQTEKKIEAVVNQAASSSVNGATASIEKVAPEEKHEEKEQSPMSNEGDILSNTADGWTLLNKDDANKKTPERESSPSVEKPQEAKAENADEKHTEDPKIANALLKMRAMGFTNEGGWLERLLITKQGNINEALDALYPNTQRH